METMIEKRIYRKVIAGDFDVRYIDQSGQWFKFKMNGKIRKSLPMPIRSEKGSIEFNIEIDPIYGERIAS